MKHVPQQRQYAQYEQMCKQTCDMYANLTITCLQWDGMKSSSVLKLQHSILSSLLYATIEAADSAHEAYRSAHRKSGGSISSPIVNDSFLHSRLILAFRIRRHIERAIRYTSEEINQTGESALTLSLIVAYVNSLLSIVTLGSTRTQRLSIRLLRHIIPLLPANKLNDIAKDNIHSNPFPIVASGRLPSLYSITDNGSDSQLPAKMLLSAFLVHIGGVILRNGLPIESAHLFTGALSISQSPSSMPAPSSSSVPHSALHSPLPSPPSHSPSHQIGSSISLSPSPSPYHQPHSNSDFPSPSLSPHSDILSSGFPSPQFPSLHAVTNSSLSLTVNSFPPLPQMTPPPPSATSRKRFRLMLHLSDMRNEDDLSFNSGTDTSTTAAQLSSAFVDKYAADVVTYMQLQSDRESGSGSASHANDDSGGSPSLSSRKLDPSFAADLRSSLETKGIAPYLPAPMICVWNWALRLVRMEWYAVYVM